MYFLKSVNIANELFTLLVYHLGIESMLLAGKACQNAMLGGFKLSWSWFISFFRSRLCQGTGGVNFKSAPIYSATWWSTIDLAVYKL